MVEYIVAIDVTRVRFLADAFDVYPTSRMIPRMDKTDESFASTARAEGIW